MSNPIMVRDHKLVCEPAPDKPWTYEEMLDLFPDGDGSLVNPLVRRCQEYEREIERLREEVVRLKAKSAYFEHDAECLGGCPECSLLYAAWQAAEKARTT